MIDRQLFNREAAPVKSSDKLPPEALLHRPKLPDQPGNDFLTRQNEGAARVVYRNAKKPLIKETEDAGEDSPQRRVGAMNPPADHDIRVVPPLPELAEVLGIALTVGIQAQQVRRREPSHSIPDGAGIAFSLIGDQKLHRHLSRKPAEDLLGLIGASVLADDELHGNLGRDLRIDLPQDRLNAVAFVVDRQQNLHLGILNQHESLLGSGKEKQATEH